MTLVTKDIIPITDAEPRLPATEDRWWQAIAERDAAFDGQFVFSVRTTGVYCRPSCPARHAKPENISFHLTCEAAEAAGFRACRRCYPNAASLAQKHAATIAKACRSIEDAEELPLLDELAQEAGMSPFHFHRLFKAATGVTPKAYGIAKRAERVRSGLADSRSSVTSAIYDAGFNSSSRFYEKSHAVLGMTPTDYRKGGENVVIRFAVGECSLGSILVAQSEKGICAILLGDDPDLLVRDLQDRFPRARLIGGDEVFDRLVAEVVGFVEHPSIGLNLPLDVRGTAFQQRVWQALRAIPAGKTVSYAEIADRIGSPKAVRAVAGACAANHIAVAIPCHRVVRHDGALSGYRWGVERKHALLVKEAKG
ncbi:bifunctional DNA-binding transcriptional regulator/O6-methylguanine-DNA methyltransferase Ada [Rhizobiaceae bacterium n13]|uniref:Bifunctional DNA-binding transcriptional regulator/O6-methylguanine-DNA methyltransferase Ada n=1 Tax=Ferirhizobium litorale TaxID=2927786 RepID=A0AAE3QBM4_9HYPH|nr:bifunctional DNA-binding transcriptional regulator/O6-methylguanine-DNA methyltransferase Ada [Fererhizobium litorale]MDI7861787.1 bifunctional DNA-binding transcriptional regulator/O6-methylguanine-DNA methyltransferase Ada [Fererhizobium litorale]MDI7921871.1 bifunctional DNA-binding transcriptional regulator/O6-methylguanine-DNA methyltransferase Ada [Fererhizobium litorale]